MADETQTAPEREIVDDSGRIRNPMSPATWTADEKPETQPGVVQPETKPETKPAPPPKPPKAA